MSPTQIVLQTNKSKPFLAFSGLERASDNSGYLCYIIVRSDWLAAEFRFIFESARLEVFIEQLERLDRTLEGRARLQPVYEEYFLEFTGDGRGHIEVTGDLIDRGPLGQRVTFTFVTDQTCLSVYKISQTACEIRAG